MTNYEKDIMNLLQGETPKQKYEYLQELLKPKEKKFERGAKAILKSNEITDHFLELGSAVILVRQLSESIWNCKDEHNNTAWVSKDEMELI